MKQKTIKHPFSLSGKGLHSGKFVTITCQPAKENEGIRFQRTDLEGQPIIEALASNVGETQRGTFIVNHGAEVKTIEHLMAALASFGIYNILIQADGEEVPILTGSSQPFVDAIAAVGVAELNAEQPVFQPAETITYRLEDGAEIQICPADSLSIEVLVDYKTKVLGQQVACLNNINDFQKEIAPCRTFCFLHEIFPLIQLGLIKGGDVENAIVYVEKDICEEEKQAICRFFGKENIAVSENGVLNTCQLFFDNEVARHKLLDVLGDITLIGRPLVGKIFAKYPGHTINTQFAKLLLTKMAE